MIGQAPSVDLIELDTSMSILPDEITAVTPGIPQSTKNQNMADSSFAKKNGLFGKNETNKVTSAVKQGMKKKLTGMSNQSKDFS